MRTRILFIFLFFFTVCCRAAKYVSINDTTVYKVYAQLDDSGLYGYVNRTTNTWVLPPCVHRLDADSLYLKKGETTYYFFGYVNGKPCIVDMEGDFLVPPVYDEMDAVCQELKIDLNKKGSDARYRQLYERNASFPHTAVCLKEKDKYKGYVYGYDADLYDVHSGRKICTLKRPFRKVAPMPCEKYGMIMYYGTYFKQNKNPGKRKYAQLRGLADFDGNILWQIEGSGTSDMSVTDADGVPVFTFEYFGKKRKSVDAFGNALSVKYLKDGTVDPASAKTAIEKLLKKKPGYRQKIDALKEKGVKFQEMMEQPLDYGNYLEMMEQAYDKCEHLDSYGDNTLLRYGGKYGMDYQNLGFALYCEYDKIEPIAGYRGLYAVKRADKWGVANELGITVRCQFDTLTVDGGKIRLSVQPEYGIYNNKTKQYMNYVEEVDSTGYASDSNLQEILTSNNIRKKDNRDNFFAIATLGENMGRNDIAALTYYYQSCVESLRGDKKDAKLSRSVSGYRTANPKLVERICRSWFDPIRDEYLQKKQERHQRFLNRLEGWIRVLDAVNTALAPLAAAPQNTAINKPRQHMSSVSMQRVSSVQRGSSTNSEILKAKKKYSHYENLLESYVKMFNDLWGRVAAGKVLAYGSSERRELSDMRSKIKLYLDECVAWRQAAARAGGNIPVSSVEGKASRCLAVENPKYSQK